MATPVELAVVELQIVVRELNRRLGGMERKLGVAPEEFARRTEPGRQVTTVGPRYTPEVARTADASLPPYDIADHRAPATPAQVPSPPASRADAAPSEEERLPTEAELMQALREAEEAAERLRSVAASTAAAASLPPQATSQPVASAAGEPSPAPAAPAATPTEPELPVLPPPMPPEPPPRATRVMDFAATYRPAEHRSTLETTLGIEVASWLGAFSVMGGLLFFLKLGLEAGYVHMSPLFRIAMAGFAGIAMIAFGTWQIRRQRPVLAEALTGAGIATLLLTVFAAYRGFAPPVLGQELSVLALLLVGALGAALAIRRNSILLIVLTFAGLYAGPMFLYDMTADASGMMLLHLLVVTIGALTVSRLRPGWEAMRLLAFIAAWIWLATWSSSQASGPAWIAGLGFIGIFFALFASDAVISLWNTLTQDKRDPDPSLPPELLPSATWDALAAAATLINTALALACALMVFDHAMLPGLWIPFVVLAAVMGALRVLVRSEYFSLSASVQSAILFLLAVPLYFREGLGATVTWEFLALLFAVYAVARNSAQARVWMLAALLLAAGRFCLVDAFDPPQQFILGTIGSTAVSSWMLTGWGLALLAILFAALSRPAMQRESEETYTRFTGSKLATVTCIALSTLLVLIINIRVVPSWDFFTLVAALWTFALVALVRLNVMQEIAFALETFAAVLLILLSAKWFLLDGLVRIPAPMPGPAWNLFTLNGLLLAGAVVALNPHKDQPAVGRRFVAWWLTALAFAWLNVQTLRAVDYYMPGHVAGLGDPELVKNVSLTVLWGLFASVMVAIGFLRRAARVRYVALTLLGVTTSKIIFVDMANVHTILRVVALMAMGVFLFLVSYLYHAHLDQLPGKSAPRGPAEPANPAV